MSRATHFVGTAGLPQEADPPADGRRFRVGPQPVIARRFRTLRQVIYGHGITRLPGSVCGNVCSSVPAGCIAGMPRRDIGRKG